MPRTLIQNFTNALNFNGTNSSTDLPKINASSALTIGLWVRVRAAGSYDLLSRPAGTSIRLMVQLNGTFRFEIGLTGSGLTIANGGSYTPNQWVHLVGRYDGTTVSLFVNGVSVGSTAGNGTISQDTSQFWHLGTLNFSAYTPMAASSAFITTSALSVSDIARLYQGTIPTGLSGFWRLNEGTGTTLTDTSGSGQNATASNTTWIADGPTKARTAAAPRPQTLDIKASLTGSGVNGYVSFGTVNMSTDTVESVMFWCKSTMSENSVLFGNSGNNTSVGFSVRKWIDGPSILLYHDSVAASSPIPAGQWVHIGAVFKNNAALYLYVNGVLASTSSATGSTSLGNTTLYIGANGSNNFGGKISRVVFGKNAEFKASDIMNHYLSGAVPNNATNVWNLEEAAGSTVYVSLSTLNGTITNDYYSKDVPVQKRLTVGDNLVYNGNFEFAPPFTAVQTGNGRFIDGSAAGSATNGIFSWGVGFGNSGSAQFDGTISHSGKYSLKVSTTGTASYAEVFAASNQGAYIGYFGKTMTPIKPSTSYTFTYWMKTNYVSGDANHGASIDLLECTGDGGSAGHETTGPYIKTTTGWTQYTITFTTVSSARFLQIDPRVYGHTGTGTLIIDAWYDDFVLTPTVNTTRGAAS